MDIDEVKTLTITWQRLVDEGTTCPRCSATGEEVQRAVQTLRASLAPSGTKVLLEEEASSRTEFERAPLDSNRILINQQPLEMWVGGSVGQSPCCGACGSNDCRTVSVDGQSYESIPADLIVRAGLLAAAGEAAIRNHDARDVPTVKSHSQSTSTPVPMQEPKPLSRIEVLGPGCAKCQETYRIVTTVLEAVGVTIPVEKVESYERMTELGILATPAVAVDGQVLVSGRVPTKDDIQALLALLLKNTTTPPATPGASGGCSCKGGCA